jgi:hypothetical protein
VHIKEPKRPQKWNDAAYKEMVGPTKSRCWMIISEGGGEELHAACSRTWRVNIRAGVQQQSTYVTVVTRSHSHGTHARKHDATRLDTENDSWPLSSSTQEVQSLRHLLASTFNVSTYHQGRLSYRWWYQPRTMWFEQWSWLNCHSHLYRLCFD